MKGFRLMCLAALACQLVGSGAAADCATANRDGSGSTLPPVLRSTEPVDSGRSPYPAPSDHAPPLKKITGPCPSPNSLHCPRPWSKMPSFASPFPCRPSPLPGSSRIPSSKLGREVAAYCQKQIGHWKESDARKLLGEPKRHRPAYDEKKAVNGTIYAYTDPTNKYKELELDFDLQTGSLRTVFVYPPRLTWQECRRLWNGPVAAADAARGRKFYSYTNRRLDVLVDPAGKVISLGWY